MRIEKLKPSFDIPELTPVKWAIGGIIFFYGVIHLLVSGLEGFSKIATVWGQILFLAYFVYGVVGRKSFGIELLPLVAFAALVLAGILWTPNTHQAVSDVANLFQGIAVFLAISGLLRINTLWNFAVAGYLAGSMLLVAVTLMSGEWLILIGEANGRLAGTTGNANRFAFAMLMCFCLTLMVWHAWHQLFQRIIILHVALISLTCLIASGSRMGLIGLFLFIILFTLFKLELHHSKFPLHLVRAGIGVFLLFVILVFVANHTLVGKRLFFSGSSAKGSNRERMTLLEKGMNLADQNLFLGVGTSGFRASPPMWGRSPHNNHFEILVNHGLLGYVLFVGFYGLIVFRLLCLTLNNSLGTSWVKGHLALCLMIFPLLLFSVAMYFKPFWYCMGIASGMSLYFLDKDRSLTQQVAV